MPDRPEEYAYPIAVRYLEVDTLGVVFNMWYLAYFDEAMSGLLAHRGMPYAELVAEGYDVMLVHSELDWTAGLRWPDRAEVRVRPVTVGETSFTLEFTVRRAGAVLCRGRSVYVCIATGENTKRPVPDRLRAALTPAGPTS